MGQVNTLITLSVTTMISALAVFALGAVLEITGRPRRMVRQVVAVSVAVGVVGFLLFAILVILVVWGGKV